jgi:hypothetical protein
MGARAEAGGRSTDPRKRSPLALAAAGAPEGRILGIVTGGGRRERRRRMRREERGLVEGSGGARARQARGEQAKEEGHPSAFSATSQRTLPRPPLTHGAAPSTACVSSARGAARRLVGPTQRLSRSAVAHHARTATHPRIRTRASVDCATHRHALGRGAHGDRSYRQGKQARR